MQQTEGVIYIAENRTHSVWGATTHAKGIEVNDIYLAPGITYHKQTVTQQSVLVVPYIGDIQWHQGHVPVLIDENQVIFWIAEANSAYKITNPYPEDTINFYEILINKRLFQSGGISDFDIQASPNQLHAINQYIWIGQYDGREEGSYQLQDAHSHVFVYIIAGVFEVQNRLLHPHDGLQLWGTQSIEFEALSSNAILMIIEI